MTGEPTRPTPAPTGQEGAAGQQGAGWLDDGLAREWAQGDRMEGLLTLPRRITADVLALGERPVRTVVDVGSGPGIFLATMLDVLPEASGIWTDVSPAMRTLAGEHLQRFGDRVAYRALSATDLAAVGSPGSVDAVVTSRVTHHLSTPDLGRFYADADRLLGEWGWIANLDHVAMPGGWGPRLAGARARVVPPNPSPHRHDRPHPPLEDHLAAIEALGDLDVVVAWRAYATVLILAVRGA
ncbi:MAG: class I SAM-dependent methyltransferase [Acidimicrobiales bacterium]